MHGMIPRHISSRLLDAPGGSPAVLLHGARQTGKRFRRGVVLRRGRETVPFAKDPTPCRWRRSGRGAGRGFRRGKGARPCLAGMIGG